MKASEKTQKIENDHADEKMSVSGSEIDSADNDNDDLGRSEPQRQTANQMYANPAPIVEGGYDPSEYSGLPVTAEVKELFKSIQRFTPTTVDIDTKLKPFIPDFIPTVGEVDAFLKMPRPDGQPQTLGLYTLDEPALNQSDKAKIDLLMANNLKQYRGGKNSKVHSIENAEKNLKQIDQWIASVADIHKNEQPPSVSYSKPMPAIDPLMQYWSQDIEELLSQISIPSEDIDLSLEDYSRVACNIVGIPVHKEGNNTIVESLHVFFTLFTSLNEIMQPHAPVDSH